jgi:hypothetical protein
MQEKKLNKAFIKANLDLQLHSLPVLSSFLIKSGAIRIGVMTEKTPG